MIFNMAIDERISRKLQLIRPEMFLFCDGIVCEGEKKNISSPLERCKTNMFVLQNALNGSTLPPWYWMWRVRGNMHNQIKAPSEERNSGGEKKINWFNNLWISCQ